MLTALEPPILAAAVFQAAHFAVRAPWFLPQETLSKRTAHLPEVANGA
jgi:hypothetical protein